MIKSHFNLCQVHPELKTNALTKSSAITGIASGVVGLGALLSGPIGWVALGVSAAAGATSFGLSCGDDNIPNCEMCCQNVKETVGCRTQCQSCGSES